ncbi:MAG: hypothetical protein U0835_01955 [Isosphaeraceae bacterium]
MSILTRTRRLSDRLVPKAPEAAPSPSPRNEPRRNLVAEAPEQAHRPTEAPESRPARTSEAPDAGHGRGFHLEHEFTHGRSQS